jgi:hypothetical protein
MISSIGKIVNDRLLSLGAEPLNEVVFYRQIENMNSRLQNVDIVDQREARRVYWLTFQAQQKSHEKFEQALVELEMARPPTDEEEREREGYVVIHENQLDRIVTYDECNISSDGSDQGRGGRPACTHSNPALPESGKPAPKSGKTWTMMVAVTLGCEAFPIYLMGTSNANAPKFSGEFLARVPQIQGKFGFEQERFFDIPFTKNPKGGMNGECHREWSQFLRMFYPTAGTAEEMSLCTVASDSKFSFSFVDCR